MRLPDPVPLRRRLLALPPRHRSRAAAALALLVAGAVALRFARHRAMAATAAGLAPRAGAAAATAACGRPERLGDDYGGWTVCVGEDGGMRGEIVYTIGVGRNIEWDKTMIARFGTVHHGWDPTPSAVDFFAKRAPPPGFHFHRYGVGLEDGEVQFKLPEGNFDSYTMLGYAGAARQDSLVSVPVLTLPSMLKLAGHTRLAVLKIDAEGVEFGLIAHWAATSYSPPARQVLIEFHERYFTSENAPGGVKPKELVPRAIAQMREIGFQLMHKHHWEYTFVRATPMP